ncbi:MAG: protein-(glutamine-N5) methyltransferase, release factor-specific [Chloroflexi bacterium RBG_13_50_21]|nr:MAG: protein-(glutamine-N5) methyltransferase, release factor-specific [Chloroflexi bacterium RBG_13_50_21]
MKISIREIHNQLSQQLHPFSETSSLDTQVLLAHYLEKPRSWILAHPEAPLNKTQYNNIIQAADRLMHGEVLPYIIGHWEFYGMDFHLTPAVLIPRPETELLVERGINWLRQHLTRRKAVDVGTGSGCIGITLVKNIPDLQVLLMDISSAALMVARDNAEKYDVMGRTKFKQADLLEGVSGPFDLICANLPYIPSSLLSILPVAKREPHLALDGGLSGIKVISRLLEQSRSKLLTGGLMLLEIESSQGLAVKTLAKAHFPNSKVQILKDLSGLDRCLEIERPGLIIHICPHDDWLHAYRRGIFQDQSLLQDGYIHCSQSGQILEVANRFYQGSLDLVLLWVDPDRLTSELRWETADNTQFLHIYGPINLDAITSVTELKPDIDGIYRVVQSPD